MPANLYPDNPFTTGLSPAYLLNTFDSYFKGAGASGSLGKTAELRKSGATSKAISQSMLEGSYTALNAPVARAARSYSTKSGIRMPEMVKGELLRGTENLATSGTNPWLNLDYDSESVGRALDVLRTDPMNADAHAAVKAHQFIANYDPTKSFMEKAMGFAMPLAASLLMGPGAAAALGAGVGVGAITSAIGGTTALASGAATASTLVSSASGAASLAQSLSGRDAPARGKYAFLFEGGEFNPNSRAVTQAALAAAPDTMLSDADAVTAGTPGSADTADTAAGTIAYTRDGIQPNYQNRQDTPFASGVGVVDNGQVDFYDEARSYTTRQEDIATVAWQNLNVLKPGERATGGLAASRTTSSEQWRSFQAEFDRLEAANVQPSIGRPRPISNNPAPIREDAVVQADVRRVVQDIGLQTTLDATILSDEDTDLETLAGGGTYRRGTSRRLAG